MSKIKPSHRELIEGALTLFKRRCGHRYSGNLYKFSRPGEYANRAESNGGHQSEINDIFLISTGAVM
jgi:hypothetical protein